MKEPEHMFEVDLKKFGDHGFRRLNAKTGREDIRTKAIPTESGIAARLKKIIDLKLAKNRNRK